LSATTEHALRLASRRPRAARQLARVYNRHVLSFHRAVNWYIGLMRDAVLYGIDQQIVAGREPIKEALAEYEDYAPRDEVEEAVLDVLSRRVARKLADAAGPREELAKAGPFGNITSVIADWHCLNFKGETRIARMNLRVYGEAYSKAAQIARVDANWDVVRPEAIRWAAERSAEQVTAINDETRQVIREKVAEAVREGKGNYELARDLRPRIGLNVRQSEALDGFKRKLADHYGSMEGGLTDSRLDRLGRAVDREARRKLRYRAEMIARTETSASLNNGALEAYGTADVGRVRLEAAADACEVCQDLDGNIYTLAEAEGIIPDETHPNCRCTWIPVIET